MAVTLDASATGSATSTTVTVPLTVSGADRLLVVGIANYRNTTENTTSVTWNTSENLTERDGQQNGDCRIELWTLTAPSTGTHNVVVTTSASTDISVCCYSLNGVDQTTPLGTSVNAGGASTTPSVTVTSATGDLVFAFLGVNSASGAAVAVGAGQTEQATEELAGANFNILESEISTEAGASSVVMNYTINNSWNWAEIGVSIKPASGGASGNPWYAYAQQ